MNWTRYILAAIGGFVALAVVGMLWHMVVSTGIDSKTVQAAIGGVIVGDALRALVLAYIYPIGYKGADAWMEGLKFGVMMGLVAGLTAGTALAVLTQPMGLLVSEFIFLVVQGAINGIVVGLIYGKQAALK